MRLAAVLLGLWLGVQDDAPDDAKIRSLIEQLGADFLEEREPARKALEKAGRAAETRLVDGLSNPDHRIRRACLELLTPLKSTPALRRASDLFAQDDDTAVREAAFHLLLALRMDAEDALIGALSSPNPEFRKGAVLALSELRSLKAVTRIADLVDRETDPEVKKSAWKCLLAAGKPAEAHLRKYLRDPDPAVRRDALQSLHGSTEAETAQAIAALFAQETDDAPLEQAYQFLKSSPAQAEPAFMAGLQNPRQPTRLKSINGLRETKNPKGLAPIGELYLGECPPDVRGAAADYLKSQGAAAEPVLLKGLDSKEVAVRLSAIQVLGEIGSQNALEPVGKLFREEKNQDVHERCFEFLRRLGIRAQAHLLAALGDENKELRCQAVIALGEAKSEEAIPRLLEFMTELDPRMREASEEALALIGPKAIEQVQKAVADGRVRKSAAEAIEANFVRNEVERVLESQLGDDEFSGFYEGQFKELETFGRDRAVPALTRILSDRSYVFRHADRHIQVEYFRNTMKELAVMALGELGGDGAIAAIKSFATEESLADDAKKRIREETYVALHRLGDRKPLEDYLRDLRQKADVALRDDKPDSKERGIEYLFSLGLLFTRLRRLDEATQVYDELLAALERNKMEKTRVESYRTTCYNLACLQSLKCAKAKAVEWL
ncbi:MAG TPA: HEAT repeat domain-containing protein, partial [Planctomycetota bacterium]|nr:HEAT repeat domain-containing protein [Planctomycetota bacterium]